MEIFVRTMEKRLMNTGLSSLRILIVEDQPEARSFLRGILEDLGIDQVYETDRGQNAMDFVRGAYDSIDCILCDWNMPGMSGVEFLRHLRENGMEIPFLMITGRGDQASVIEVRNLGLAGYIRKPFSVPQIEARLRILLQRIKAA